MTAHDLSVPVSIMPILDGEFSPTVVTSMIKADERLETINGCDPKHDQEDDASGRAAAVDGHWPLPLNCAWRGIVLPPTRVILPGRVRQIRTPTLASTSWFQGI